MARHFYFLLLCFALVTFAHGDCLADQERYDKTFEKMFPVCDEECTKKRRIHEADFAELFPQCKAFTTQKHLITGLINIDSHHVNVSTINGTKMHNCAEKRRIYDAEKHQRVAKLPKMTIYGDFNTKFYDKYPECKPKHFVDLGLIQSSSGDCLADQERYNENFRMFYPTCRSNCNEERQLYDNNFDKLFPQCKASKDSEHYGSLPSTTPHKNLGTGLTKIDGHHVNASTINDTKIQSCAEKRRIYDDEKQQWVAKIPYHDFNTNGLRGNVNSTTFYDQYPECKPKNYVDVGLIQGSSNAVVNRRRLVQRYNLCNLGTPTNSNGGTWSIFNKYYSGEHTITANCSILSTICIRGTLKITGVADSNGVKPAIDGGWDGVVNSNTGVELFHVGNNDELVIENMILTNGEVSTFCSYHF